MAGPDPHRLVGVLAPKPGGESLGTGYLIGDTLVLTAWHVVKETPAGGNVSVVFPEPPAGGVAGHLGAIAVWHDPDLDACLLRITEDGWSRADDPAARWWSWGLIHGDRQVEVRSVGFPRAARRDGKARRHVALGRITPGTGGAGRAFALQVTNETPLDAPDGTQWAGMSGAPVFAGPYLVAMLISDPANWGPERLDALKVERLRRAAGFVETCEGDGVPTTEEPIRGSAAGVAVPEVQTDFEIGLDLELKAIDSESVYREIGAILGFGDDDLSAQHTAILARQIVANAGTVASEILQAVWKASPARAGAIYTWVAPRAWVSADASQRVRDSLALGMRPRVLAVTAEWRETVEALVRHAGGLFNKLPFGWFFWPVKWPEGEQPPDRMAGEIKKALGIALGISTEDEDEGDDWDDNEADTPADGEPGAPEDTVFLLIPRGVPTLPPSVRTDLAATSPSPVLVLRCKPEGSAAVSSQIPDAVVIDMGIDPQVESQFHKACVRLRRAGALT